MKTEKQQRMAAYGFSTKMTESECMAYCSRCIARWQNEKYCI